MSLMTSGNLARAISPLLLLIALTSCTKQEKNPISITVDPPRVKIEKKKVETQKKDFDAAEHEIAQTDWIYSIVPKLAFSIKEKKQEKTSYTLSLVVTGVEIKLGLPITTKIYESAPQYVIDHENGHVKICTRIYDNARAIAQKAAQEVVGKTYVGSGSDEKQALSSALQMAAQDIAAPYRVSTVAYADAVSSNYDQLCEKEDRRKLVEKTIDEAFDAVKKEEQKQNEAQNLQGTQASSDTSSKPAESNK